MSTSPTGTTRPPVPLSPASPQSESLRKAAVSQAIKTVAQNPQTPTSPSSMSASSNRHASPQTSAPTSQSITNDSSPSAVPMSAQNSQQPLNSSTYTLPTPASSVVGALPTSKDGENMARSLSAGTNDGFPSTSSKRSREEDSENEGSEKRRKTNHDRIEEPPNDPMDLSEDHPTNIVQAETSHMAQRSRIVLGKDWMREPIGKPYLLCKEPHPITRPHPSDDLIAQYGLSKLAATVARTLPNGEKNKLRKTYKGKIVAANIAGRDKETKHPEGEPGSLPELIAWPDEEWHIQKASGIDVDKGMPDSVLSKLSRAFKMEAGPMPDFDDSILGLYDEPLPSTASAPSNPSISQSRNTVQSTTAVPTEPTRQRRHGAKRSYADGSFEGYGEGFVDDELDRDGHDSGSGGEGRRGSGPSKKKRRRTDYVQTSNNASTPSLSDRSASYGMMGMGRGGGTGISVHGR